MDIKPIAEDMAVAGQITADDVAGIKEAGFKSLICNRPDGEEANQPLAADIEAAARDAGLHYRFVPVVSGAITMDDVAQMTEALDALPRPVLAYCRSGARCINLIQLTQRR